VAFAELMNGRERVESRPRILDPALSRRKKEREA